MNWCTEYQCWCADLNDVVNTENQRMECQVMSCEDCWYEGNGGIGMTDAEFAEKLYRLRKYCPYKFHHFCDGSPNITQKGTGQIEPCKDYINGKCTNKKVQEGVYGRTI